MHHRNDKSKSPAVSIFSPPPAIVRDVPDLESSCTECESNDPRRNQRRYPLQHLFIYVNDPITRTNCFRTCLQRCMSAYWQQSDGGWTMIERGYYEEREMQKKRK
ncbi:hypothetical protein NECAME_13778 [Necator americanus]|uniref:Uncharacterized protein n=1 Tax=Necator americanus TaxID=51031 RepID=W2SST5_NECAM|nr:hypothetical protein NECAME_13778 [Necator americanus]ETN72695.1 hypothetical protein NECAME_13778 [Necator americanus]